MKKLLLKNYPYLLFIAALLSVSYIYNYQDIIFKKPQSIHKWRQADGGSIALNYYQGGMHFFKPEVHNLTSDGGTSGKCYPSEAPIFYYTVAVLYKIFGYHDWIYRGLNTLIFFLGLLFFFKLLLYLLKDVFWAITIPLLIFTSPVLVYYANNYLVNSTALALSLIAWYYFVRFLFESKKKWFYVSIFFFLLASLLKVTALFSLIAFLFIYALELIKLKKFNDDKKLFSPALKFLLPIGLVFIVVGAWLKSAHDYNIKHDCTYFSTTAFPIWELSKDEIQRVIENVKNIWLTQYFHISIFVFFSICFFYLIFKFKATTKFFAFIILAVLLQAVAYIILQFRQFADHDYYAVDLLILPILIIISAFELLRRNHKKLFSSPILKGVFFILITLNVYYAQSKVSERYNSWMNDYPANEDLYSITPYLRQIGLTANDTVISIPDGSHVSLYLMNQKGWTEYKDARLNRGTPVSYNADSAGIQLSINRGAKYLIINGVEELYKRPYLRSFATYLIGTYNKVLIFQLKNKKDNYRMDTRKVKRTYFCNAETLTVNKEFFINTEDSTMFEFGKTQSNTFARRGKHSCQLTAAMPYGMTIKIKDVKYGESFVVSAWRKIAAEAKSSVIVQSDSYYNNDYNVVEVVNGWEKISKEFFITNELNGKELVIYLYNNEKTPVYFDDFEIIRYESLEDVVKY